MKRRKQEGGESTPQSARIDRSVLEVAVLEAAALESEERLAYLHRLRGEDSQVADRVREILAAADQVADSFLAAPAIGLLDGRDGLGAGAEEPFEEAAEELIDPARRYTLGPMLGRGGMAEVFRAHDHQLDRPIALKLLTVNGPANLNSCLREARAQARIQHGNVLAVYDTGEFDGRPFIALRLVEGTTLDRAWPGRSLERQVALLVGVADGLEAAHRAGLIHRDVKPSNVLVEEVDDSEPRIWVSDFGIAATVEAADHRLSGTVPYLAPERLDPEATADSRADLWSFGVMAYELLTGVLPFDPTDLYERLRAIRRRPPASLRQHRPELPADLEAIVLRCLAKDPNDRYDTAAALAADLRRFLAGEVVQAHAATVAYRAARFVLRHRGWVRFASLALVVVAVSLVVAAVQGWRAVQSEQQVVLRRQQAEELINFMLLELRDKLDRLGRLELLDDVGTEAMRYFATVPASELADGELARYATALHQIGEVRLRRGELASAVEAFDQSLALAQAGHDRQRGDDQRLFDLGQSHFWLGHGLREQGEMARAERSFTSYLEVSQQLVARDATDPAWQLELAYAHNNLGTLYQDRGENPSARLRFESALEITQRLATATPADQDLQSDLAWAHNALGVVLIALGEPQEALRQLGAELAIRRALVATAPGDARWRDDLGVSLNYFGLWQLKYASWPRAAEHFAAAVEIYQELTLADPEDAARRLRLAINRTALGRTLAALNQTSAGRNHLEEARRLLEEGRLEDHTTLWRGQLAAVHYQLALLEWREGSHADSHSHLQLATSGFEELLAAAPGDRLALLRLAMSRVLWGDLQTVGGDSAAAREAWVQAQEWTEQRAEHEEHSLLALRVQIRSRLDGLSTAADLVTELREAGFCDPSFLDLYAADWLDQCREGRS